MSCAPQSWRGSHRRSPRPLQGGGRPGQIRSPSIWTARLETARLAWAGVWALTRAWLQPSRTRAGV